LISIRQIPSNGLIKSWMTVPESKTNSGQSQLLEPDQEMVQTWLAFPVMHIHRPGAATTLLVAVNLH
jgi:hypothetical protein